jgi:hypothetical protein
MKRKQILQISFFVLLILGIALTFFRMTKSYGFLLICIIQPIVALYYISIFKKEETEENKDLTLRIPLLISLQATFVVLLIKYLFTAMHWSFAGPITLLLFVLSIFTLLFSIGFVVANRKIIKSVFVVELTIMMLPILLLLGNHAPKEYSRSQYSEALNKEYQDLSQIKSALYKEAKQDTLLDLTTVDFISNVKNNVINMSGGVEEDGTIAGSLQHFYMEDIKPEFERRKRKDLIKEIILEKPETVIECLNVLTKLQIDLLLKEKK